MGMAQEGIPMQRMMAKPKHLIFEGVSEAALVQAFLDNRNSMQAEEARWLQINQGMTIEIKFKEKFR